MATQQQFPLDPNTALTSVWMRNAGRKRHQDEVPALAPVIMQGEQLRSYAQMEAQSWRVIDSKDRNSLLEVKWREAKESIERRCQALRHAAAAGHVLKGEALALADNVSFLREGLKDVREAVHDTGHLTQVESGACQHVPRAYASVASYFRAVNYEFNEKTFDQFFKALQPPDRRCANNDCKLAFALRYGLEGTIRANQCHRANLGQGSVWCLRANGFRKPRQLPQGNHAVGRALEGY